MNHDKQIETDRPMMQFRALATHETLADRWLTQYMPKSLEDVVPALFEGVLHRYQIGELPVSGPWKDLHADTVADIFWYFVKVWPVHREAISEITSEYKVSFDQAPIEVELVPDPPFHWRTNIELAARTLTWIANRFVDLRIPIDRLSELDDDEKAAVCKAITTAAMDLTCPRC